jgi:hypothetical protein
MFGAKDIAIPTHKRFWRDWTTLEKTQAVFDFFLVVFSAGLLWTSYNQWDVAKGAVAGASKAFVYAKKEIATQEPPKSQTASLDDIVPLTLHFENTDSTPTRHVKIVINLASASLPDNYDYPDVLTSVDQHHNNFFFIAPHEILPITVNNLTLGAIAAIRLHLIHFTIYGHVDYADVVFGAPHTTQFCVYWNGTATAAGGSDLWMSCDKHNCVDEDCPNWSPRVMPRQPPISIDPQLIKDALRKLRSSVTTPSSNGGPR